MKYRMVKCPGCQQKVEVALDQELHASCPECQTEFEITWDTNKKSVPIVPLFGASAKGPEDFNKSDLPDSSEEPIVIVDNAVSGQTQSAEAKSKENIVRKELAKSREDRSTGFSISPALWLLAAILLGALYYLWQGEKSRSIEVDSDQSEAVLELSGRGSAENTYREQINASADSLKEDGDKLSISFQDLTERKQGAEQNGAQQVSSEGAGVNSKDSQSQLSKIDSATRRALAEESLRSFLEAESIGQRLNFVRNPKKAKQAMTNYYHSELPRGEGSIPHESLGIFSYQSDDLLYTAMGVALKNGEEVVAGMEWVDGKYLVDWESFVRYSEMNWEEFQEKKPTSPVLMRVNARVDDYYNYQFSSNEDWLCLLIYPAEGNSPITEPLYGYAPLKAAAASQLKKLAPESGSAFLGGLNGLNGASQTRRQFYLRPMVISICYPPNLENDQQVLITDFHTHGWMIRDTASASGASEEVDLQSLE